MRMFCSAVLLAMSTAACSSEVSSVAASALPAAAQPPKPAASPAMTPSAPSRLSPRTTFARLAQARTMPINVTAPSHTRGAIVATSMRGGAGDDIAMAVTVDGSSNLIVAGVVGPSADIGCGIHESANGGTYVTKSAPDGTCSWAVYFDGTGFVSPSAVKVGADGSVFVVGSFDETATFDAPYTSAGGLDGFLVKIGSDGTLAWARTFGSTDDEYPYALAVSGNTVAVGGAFYGTMLLGGAGGASWTSNGDADAFLATYSSPDGGLVASRAFGGPGWDAVNGLAFDEGAQLLAAGTHAGDIDLGMGNVATAGGQDGFVSVYDSSLAATAVRSFGGTGDDAAHGILVDATSRIIVAGYFMNAADVGAPSLLTGAGQYTAFWAAYDSTLAFATAATLDADGGIIAEALGIGPTGDILIGGQFTGATDAGALQMTAGAGRAGYAASFSPSGTLVWATPIRGSGDAEILGVVATASGVVAVGASNGSLECSTEENAGGSDAVMMKLDN
jgi:hypothetical protein